MHMAHSTVTLLFLACIVTIAIAHEGCGTADPSPIEKRMDLHRMQQHEHQHKDEQAEGSPTGLSTRSATTRAATVPVDLVFHLLADNQGVSGATRIWTSDAISNEVARINQHFSSTAFTFRHAKTIVTRNAKWSSSSIQNDDVVDDMVASLRVGGADVANIFVTDGTCKTTGGFSSYPRDYGWFPEGTFTSEDRIFICPEQIGALGDGYFHTLVTHELGHWFGLRHTFQGRNCDPNNPNDMVDDTPQHKQRSSNADGCAIGLATTNTCPNLPGRDPVKNFMNGGTCRNEFTKGQGDRMYAQFNAYRRALENRCGTDFVGAKFEVRFDSKPEEMQIAFAEYIDGDRDWTDLKLLEPESHLDYANQLHVRNMCLLRRTLYQFVVRDTAENGFDSPGYSSLTIGGKQIARETDFDDEWQTTFVVVDTCLPGQQSFSVDVFFDGDEEEISWEIRDFRGAKIVSQETTAVYTDAAYRRLYVEQCLNEGDYVFTIYDSAGNGLQDPGHYDLAIDGKEFFKGGGDSRSFSSSESTSFTVAAGAISSHNCFSGTTFVSVAGKGKVEMKDLLIGDLVHVGDGKFEPVYSFGHYQPSQRASFLRIQTVTTFFEVSEDHLVFTSTRGTIPANLLVVGDKLLDSTLTAVIIDSITVVTSKGVFAPFTASGKLIVGDVLASSFIAFDNHERLRIGPLEVSHQWVAHTFEFPHRVYCNRWNCAGETYDSMGINKQFTSSIRVTEWILGQQTFLRYLLLCIVFVVLLILRCLEAVMWLFNLL